MTCRISAVAVCRSSASRVSVNKPRVLHRDHRLRREVLQQARSRLSVNGRTSWR